MPALRGHIIDEIKHQVDAKELTCWWQYPEIIEPYDAHPFEEDGWHDAMVEVVDADPSIIEEQRKLEAAQDEADAAEEEGEEDFAGVDEDCPSLQEVLAGAGTQGAAHAPVAGTAGRPADEHSPVSALAKQVGSLRLLEFLVGSRGFGIPCWKPRGRTC